MRQENLIGKEFGLLKVIDRDNDYVAPNGQKVSKWICKCQCGNIKSINKYSLLDGRTKSCGCLNKKLVRQRTKKYNTYDLSGEYGIGYTSKEEPFYFDLEDYDLIKNYCWLINTQTGYVCTRNRKHQLKLHKLLFPYDIIDHKNHNKADNRKENLRIVTSSKNSMNRKISKNNSSGVTGVCWHKKSQRWVARITVDNHRIELGSFSNFEDAVKARKEAEEKYFGEYSYDNSVGEGQCLKSSDSKTKM